MKAISVRQPWAWAMFYASAPKDIENRSWSTKYRGSLLIHASLANSLEEWDACMDLLDRIAPLDRDAMVARRALAFNTARYGGVVGVVDMVGISTTSESAWFTGPYGFVLANPRPLPFTPWKGRLGLFDIPNEEVAGL